MYRQVSTVQGVPVNKLVKDGVYVRTVNGQSGDVTLTGGGGTLQEVTDEGATTTVESTFSGGLITPQVKASTSAGLDLKSNSGTDIGRLGAGGGAGVTWYGNHAFSQMTEGSIGFFGANGLLSQDNQNFYWNSPSRRLGVYASLGTELLTNPNFTGLNIALTEHSVRLLVQTVVVRFHCTHQVVTDLSSTQETLV
jgi:hypothetical protein